MQQFLHVIEKNNVPQGHELFYRGQTVEIHPDYMICRSAKYF